jgi:hypothetical protein
MTWKSWKMIRNAKIVPKWKSQPKAPKIIQNNLEMMGDDQVMMGDNLEIMDDDLKNHGR